MAGTEAAVDVPSRRRVPSRTGMEVVRPVMSAALAPKTGPSSMIGRMPSRSHSTPKRGESVSSVT